MFECGEELGTLTVGRDVRRVLGPHVQGVRSRHEAETGASDEHINEHLVAGVGCEHKLTGNSNLSQE
ncbi:hypothetical protein E2C01_086872 [Portunus trituberculatus]|uniref:Uncharacterized protein n=1 Tax=Portunus trituberculatus TaxID=210409 RepID=A0A5B7J6I4_PORTR|nr:hypothetical protein [Portunus trituberculatus]